MAESPEQRRKALALLAMAVRIYGLDPDDEATESECEAFQRAGVKIFDIPPGTLGCISGDEVVAAMLAEDAATAEGPPKRGRGRPPTPRKHAWITCTIEAYFGTGLTRTAAIKRAAEKWGLALWTIDEIYRDNKLLAPKSNIVRDLFSNDKTEEVDAAIKEFREAEKRA